MNVWQTIVSWFTNTSLAVTGRVIPFILIMVCGILLIQILLTIVKKFLARSRLEKAAHSLILSVIRVTAYVMLALIGASKLGIDTTGLVALASVVTLAVSLALQNSLANLIGGFTLLNTKPFASGDYVEIAGQSGTVKEIGMAYTKLLTPDNKLTYIPNASVVSAEIVNYTCTGTRRLDVTVNAAYEAPVEKVLEALREAGDVEQALDDPAIFVAVTNYGESAIEYTLRIWCRTDDYWPANFLIKKRVKEIFDREGLEMTYPNLNVHIKQ